MRGDVPGIDRCAGLHARDMWRRDARVHRIATASRARLADGHALDMQIRGAIGPDLRFFVGAPVSYGGSAARSPRAPRAPSRARNRRRVGRPLPRREGPRRGRSPAARQQAVAGAGGQKRACYLAKGRPAVAYLRRLELGQVTRAHHESPLDRWAPPIQIPLRPRQILASSKSHPPAYPPARPSSPPAFRFFGKRDAFDRGVQTCLEGGRLSACECRDSRSSTAPASTVCGSGTVDEGEDEACDDGNLVSDDGCSPLCVPDGRPPAVGSCPGQPVVVAPESAVRIDLATFARGSGDAIGTIEPHDRRRSARTGDAQRGRLRGVARTAGLRRRAPDDHARVSQRGRGCVRIA